MNVFSVILNTPVDIPVLQQVGNEGVSAGSVQIPRSTTGVPLLFWQSWSYSALYEAEALQKLPMKKKMYFEPYMYTYV